MLFENQTSLRAAIDELKHAIVNCMGEDHESTGVLAQIERTVAAIEQKAISIAMPEPATAGAPADKFTASSQPTLSPT
jgi:hypothetical protein